MNEVAKEDADAVTINAAIENTESDNIQNIETKGTEYKESIVVVGQDIYLLVLLNQ